MEFLACSRTLFLTFSISKDLNILTNSSVLTKSIGGTEKFSEFLAPRKNKVFGGTKMATFTVSIPNELKERLDKHPDINWAEYLKERFAVRLKQFKKFQELVNRGEI